MSDLERVPTALDRSADLRAWVQERDADLVAAVADVDRTLLAETLAMRPLDRVRACTKAAETLARFRRDAS